MSETKSISIVESKLISSVAKVFPTKIEGEEISEISALQNEPFSFQFAFRKADKTDFIIPSFIKVETDLPQECIKQYRVDNVPVLRPVPEKCEAVLGDLNPGIYPDMLLERKTNSPADDEGRWSNRYFERDEKNLIDAFEDVWQSIWFTVNEKEEVLPPGEYSITVTLMDGIAAEPSTVQTLKIKIIPALLPKQSLIYTAWFHYDCLADIYGVEIFSEEYFKIVESFLISAAKTGMNMLLLPAFTPPLDTSIDKERTTAQLVKIAVEKGEYIFDFSLFKRFIKTAEACGITYFEHSHLFTQWGAKNAPKIIATVDGKAKRIFGWDTDANAEEYKNFLCAYFKALAPVLEELKIAERIMFHISDEPMENHLENYVNAAKIIKSILPNATLFEALSHYNVFEKSPVDIPVVFAGSADFEKFKDSDEDFWCYITGEHTENNLPNRLITSPYASHRITGIMLYYSGAKGFLHWGFNYYYGELSHGVCPPQMRADFYCGRPGSAYMVYPGFDRKPITSVRMKVFYDAVNDYRALQKLEQLTDRKTVLAFITDFFKEMSFNRKADEKELLMFRKLLNSKIEELSLL